MLMGKRGEVFFKNMGYNKIIEKCTRFIIRKLQENTKYLLIQLKE